MGASKCGYSFALWRSLYPLARALPLYSCSQKSNATSLRCKFDGSSGHDDLLYRHVSLRC
jgi:hypothetical protein